VTPVRSPRRRAVRGWLGLGLLAALIGAGVLSVAPSGGRGLLPTRTLSMTLAAPSTGTAAAGSGQASAAVHPPTSSGQAPAGGSASPAVSAGAVPAAGSSRSATVARTVAGTTSATSASTTVAPPGVALVPGAAGNPGGSLPPAGATTGTGQGAGQAQAGCGLLDVGCHVTSAINGWFTSVVKSALAPILQLLGHSVLATPQVTGPGRVADLWGAAAAIANTVVVLLVLAGGAVVMGHETVQTRYAAKDIAPRVVLAVIAANASLPVAGMAIALANSLSAALLGPGVQVGTATGALTALVGGSVASGGIVLVLMGLVVAVLGLVLLAVYVIRVALLVLLITGAPLALVCHALPYTDGVARLWWRAVAGLLAVQVAQTLVLITALRVFFAAGGHGALGLASSGGLVDLLVVICLLYVLVRIPSWVSRAVFAGTGHSASGTVRAVKTVVGYQAARAGYAALA